ncbi:MAG TPA: D-alanine--D-alanine ligase [Desulfuromonadales bacterium]|nr:D-alanine--D-alanine ligase [Desulfuromonadales bacterium]
MDRQQMRQDKIAVLRGGQSAEREVSLKTGTAVLNALQAEGYQAVAIDPGPDLPKQLREAEINLAFLCLHGRFGEDGTIQGLLEMMRIPYTGSGVLASSLCFDKLMTKQILLYHELPTPAYLTYESGDDRTALFRQCRHYPLITKPVHEGSTIGITIVRTEEDLERGLDEALRHDRRVLIEDYIAGSEVTVSVLNGEALPIIQIEPKSGFYDYRAKYTSGQTEYILPAPLNSALYDRIQQAAVQVCALLGCRGAARVDFMVRKREFFCLEINTIPGMTETSLLPKAAGHARIPFSELVQRMLEDAGLDK